MLKQLLQFLVLIFTTTHVKSHIPGGRLQERIWRVHGHLSFHSENDQQYSAVSLQGPGVSSLNSQLLVQYLSKTNRQAGTRLPPPDSKHHQTTKNCLCQALAQVHHSLRMLHMYPYGTERQPCFYEAALPALDPARPVHAPVAQPIQIYDRRRGLYWPARSGKCYISAIHFAIFVFSENFCHWEKQDYNFSSRLSWCVVYSGYQNTQSFGTLKCLKIHDMWNSMIYKYGLNYIKNDVVQKIQIRPRRTSKDIGRALMEVMNDFVFSFLCFYFLLYTC